MFPTITLEFSPFCVKKERASKRGNKHIQKEGTIINLTCYTTCSPTVMRSRCKSKLIHVGRLFCVNTKVYSLTYYFRDGRDGK